MGLSLSTKTPGSPDNAFEWLLHNSDITLATGFSVSLGDGTESALYLKSGIVGVTSAGGRHEFTSAATATRSWTLADANGTIFPQETFRTTSNVNNSTVTPTSGIATELNFTPVAGGIYEFDLIAFAQSAATTTGIRIDLAGPVQVAEISWQSRGPAASAANELTDDGFSLPAQFLGVAVPAATTPYIVRIVGTFRVTGTPASAMQVQVYSEVAASQVTLLPGSSIRYRKIN